MINFLSLIKNSVSYKTIIADKKANRLNHAYLVITNDGTMGRNYVKALAKAIMCESDEPCEGCRTCSLIEQDIHPDVILYPKKGKALKAEEIAEIIEEAYLKPIENDKKVIIIDKAEEMNISAQNKLLKTLEEPPKNVHFLICAQNEFNILSTVKSRSKLISVPSFNEKQLFLALKDDYSDSGKLREAISCSDGTVGKVIELYQDENLMTTIDFVCDMLTNMKSSKDVLKFSEKINTLKIDTQKLLEILETLLRDLLVYKEGKGELALNKKQVELLKDVKGFSVGAIISILEKVNEAEKKDFFNANSQMTNEWMLFQILEVKYKWQKL